MVNTPSMGRKKLDRERINITLPRGMADRLTEAAAAKGWDRSRLIEELAAEYLKGEKQRRK